MANHDCVMHRVDDGSCHCELTQPAISAEAAGICVRIPAISGNDNNGGNNHADNNHGDNDHDNNGKDKGKTASPIKHVIILIGENRGLDHTFGVYKPKGKGADHLQPAVEGHRQRGWHAGPELRSGAAVLGRRAAVLLHRRSGDRQVTLQRDQRDAAAQHQRRPDRAKRHRCSVPDASHKPASKRTWTRPSLDILTTGATGLPAGSLDTRVPGAGTLVGPFAMQGPALTDDDYTGDTTHRFYSDWQQDDCSVANATKSNTSGCQNDLFPFVMATYAPTGKSMGNSMGFYNAQQESGSDPEATG